MQLHRFLAVFALAIAGFLAYGDAANTLVTFSTQGPDFYADGKTKVKDGEWYALVWSPRAEFGGIDVELKPVVEGDKIFLMAPLAKGARCPTVVYQLDSKVAPSSGNYFVYLLDTRNAQGAVAGRDEATGLPTFVRGSVATTATGKGGTSPVVTNEQLQRDAEGNVVWNPSDASGVGAPTITGYTVEGGKSFITVSGMAPQVLYNVFTGNDLGAISQSTLAVPLTASDNDVEFVIDNISGDKVYLNVQRHPLDK